MLLVIASSVSDLFGVLSIKTYLLFEEGSAKSIADTKDSVIGVVSEVKMELNWRLKAKEKVFTTRDNS